jgi:hypothetical protein
MMFNYLKYGSWKRGFLNRLVHVPHCTNLLALAHWGKAFPNYMQNGGGKGKLIFLLLRPAASVVDP